MLSDTLGNEDWLRKNESALKEILPETWTHIDNLNGLQIGFKLKLIGVDWRSEDEFARCMVALEFLGIMLRDGLLVRRANRTIYG